MKEIGKIYVDRKDGYEKWCGEFGGISADIDWSNFLWNWTMNIVDGKPCLINHKHTENYYGHASREATEDETIKIRELYNKVVFEEHFRIHGCYVIYHKGEPESSIIKVFKSKDKAISYIRKLIESWKCSIVEENENYLTIKDKNDNISVLCLIKQVIEE